MVCFLMLSIFAGWGEGTSRDEVIEVNTKIMKRVRSQRRWAQQERRWQRQELKHHMKVKVTQSCPTLWDPRDPWNSLGQNTGVGRLSLLQGIFPTQGSNPGLPHCRWIIYQLNHKGSPRIQEWVAYPFSTGSSIFRDWTCISCVFIIGRQILHYCATWEACYLAFYFFLSRVKTLLTILETKSSR